ncbi:MAG: tRNA (N(6)-L-threonylcarbamoyladenosine(37)-C(2))-methylthiotransferase MtaB [Oscillospiraceae bacterium]|nr:tRNA (N(6)-L-threonylcarbamoyladenosine(37)-C(2))-methylthiotransferase MtaB [Oscillospiraceae bacterium]
MKFCTTTLGCKVNQVDTEAVEGALISNGHVLAEAGDGCDACIINTCAVTAESVRKSRQAVRRMRKLEPGALIAVCGCLSQLEAEAAEALGADVVGGSADRLGFALEIEKLCAERSDGDLVDFRKLVDGGPPEGGQFEELPLCGPSGRTRAFLKIEDGCDNFCAYCVIPYARGRVRSLPLERIAAHAQALAERSFKEIVVTGVEISSYGKDLASGTTIIDAVREISRAAPNVRLRLGSLAPSALTKEFCGELAAFPNICGHFHISLQSGCDETLRRMGRKYEAGAVMDAMSSLRALFPDCGITADLITGFPGETDEEFEQTLSFIKAARFSSMHVFPFSQRPGTKAADMPEQVKKMVRRERAHVAKEAADVMAADFARRQIGKTVQVLFERERNGFWTGHSENYIEVAVRQGGRKNAVFTVKLTDIADGRVFGEIRNR